jgi:hypothetical protein
VQTETDAEAAFHMGRPRHFLTRPKTRQWAKPPSDALALVGAVLVQTDLGEMGTET